MEKIRKKKLVKGLAALSFIFIAIAACLIPYQPAVVFMKEDSGDLIAFLPLQKKKNFDVIYTHSIHKTKVVESYVWENKKIRQTALSYHDPAVGMPANAGEGEKLVIKNGIYTISNMKRTFPYIDMRIGRVRANHRIRYNGKVHELKRYIRPGSWTRMSVQKLNVLQQLRGVKING
ncbi:MULTISPECIES: DUF1850 domain-containing protein [Bacillus]|uniref:DUF1850 domain-containing protein n=1 Tax=Bacillus TaxID=1386 RepID=UPI001F359097|nr:MULTISPECIES: DUF1850 domain-containing protein [Bacillus]WFA03618.1 DUF1850 domain-containing protein [Bacillus sp. HSf4]